MKDTVDVTIMSRLNVDCFVCEGKDFIWSDTKGLKEFVGDREVNWVRGRNVFTGEPVSDTYFNSMKERYEETI